MLSAGLAVAPAATAGVEAVRRRHADGRSYRFLLNHGDTDADVAGSGTVLAGLPAGTTVPGSVRVPARGVVVLRESTDPPTAPKGDS